MDESNKLDANKKRKGKIAVRSVSLLLFTWLKCSLKLGGGAETEQSKSGVFEVRESD